VIDVTRVEVNPVTPFAPDAATRASERIQNQIQEARSGVSDAERSSQQTPVSSQATSPLPGIFGLAADPEDN